MDCVDDACDPDAHVPAPPHLTVVCDGWLPSIHPRVVLRYGDPDADLSHGMCDRCQRLLTAILESPPRATLPSTRHPIDERLPLVSRVITSVPVTS